MSHILAFHFFVNFATLQMITNYLIDKEIHPLQQELQTTVMTSLSVKQFSASLSLSKPRYAKNFTWDDLRAVAVHECSSELSGVKDICDTCVIYKRSEYASSHWRCFCCPLSVCLLLLWSRSSWTAKCFHKIWHSWQLFL